MTDPLGPPGSSSSFMDSLGARAVRRAEPRTSIAIAGAGCALGILGVLVIAGDTGLDDGSGDFNKVPGILLSGLVVAAGFFVLANSRRGAVATAGTVAAAVGIPPFMFFLTFDQDSLPPYSTEGILIVSTGVWLASYIVGPGRGRPFFLGAGLIGLWLTLLQVTENVFDAPFDALGLSFDTTGGDLGGGGFGSGSFDQPDPATIGMLSLGLGLAFLLTGRWLDKGGRHGAATPFALAALPCLVVGVIGMAPDLEVAGTGLLMVGIGLGLAYHGATVWRRATTWIGGGVTALGLGIFLSDMTDDATIGGMLFIAGGIGLVFAGHGIATAISEPDEMDITVALVPVSPGSARTITAPAQPPEPPAPVDTGQWAAPAPPVRPPPPPPPPGPAANDPPLASPPPASPGPTTGPPPRPAPEADDPPLPPE